ncbi:DegT/DnrJ/EryC1/StrS aminotransferase family protein [Paenibacillus sp. PAMC21692]|uniref:DegT/DnrJ/EryC1/StrS family aminotransferase n=1 Tax=Paenibacillus sp. PAMC21692 TaxID=2762320 RepID=UPI00164DF4F6|nr:DegT/DnrJ/EryC1/StrS family aminotransferase [Paenibacillus sp. PAMC21692]QNK56296.1 DegT/DnrJ/EryC1/StrS family aminotransferase [Paenibacillus sp. PAMC21692]
MSSEELALFGGTKAVATEQGDLFTWPIITQEDEEAALDVLRKGAMSGIEVTEQFEADFRDWLGMDYALGFNNGTNALLAAMYGCGVGVGDEIICPSITYWASCTSAYSLGATVVFADIDPVTLCMDPKDIERCISERTKAIVVVHYVGHPAAMDEIMAIANKYQVKVIEDVSHAHGGIYKGKKLGTIGHVAGMSMMSGKALAVGEAGMLVTRDREIYERAIALGHYERYDQRIETKSLQPFIELPLGGYKFRMHQLSSAVGRVQLRHYDARHEQISLAMNYFWDLLEDVPGLRAHRPEKGSGIYMGGWYAARGHYVPEELGGLSITRFTEAVRAEGVEDCYPGCNIPLHTHLLNKTADVYSHGKPTRIATSHRDVRQLDSRLPVTEGISARLFTIPWFKHFRKSEIEQYANAYRKAALNYERLLESDQGNPSLLGGWNMFAKLKKKEA